MTRILDIAIAAVALTVTAPVLVVLAVAIKLDSRGPVIYRQTRVGRHGAPFAICKLRTMTVGAEHQGARLYIEPGDARITRVGAFLRRFSLDELPNLVNVLRGEMSVVGPRPTVSSQVERYTPHQRRRLEVKPGITGWAQVNGRTSISWPERIDLDVWYVDHRGTALDLKILVRTARMLATGEGLYSSELEQGWGEKKEPDA